jgi:hypothetical protein
LKFALKRSKTIQSKCEARRPKEKGCETWGIRHDVKITMDVVKHETCIPF